MFTIDTWNGRRSTNDFLFSSIKTLIVITGPTASGKTALSIEVAKALGLSIISADSRQFYKELKIGTARPTRLELAQAPHFFIASHSIQNELTAAQFAKEATQLIEALPNDRFIITGGSGMFIDALTEGLDDLPHAPEIREQLNQEWKDQGLPSLIEELKEKDPVYASSCDLNNPMRVIRALSVIRATGHPYSNQLNKRLPPSFRVLRFIIDAPREVLYDRINARVDQMIEAGLVEEAASLYPLNNKIVENTVGYKELIPYFKKEITLEKAIDQVKMNSRRYAKRQITWFKRYTDAFWVPFDSTENMCHFILKTLNTCEE